MAPGVILRGVSCLPSAPAPRHEPGPTGVKPNPCLQAPPPPISSSQTTAPQGPAPASGSPRKSPPEQPLGGGPCRGPHPAPHSSPALPTTFKPPKRTANIPGQVTPAAKQPASPRSSARCPCLSRGGGHLSRKEQFRGPISQGTWPGTARAGSWSAETRREWRRFEAKQVVPRLKDVPEAHGCPCCFCALWSPWDSQESTPALSPVTLGGEREPPLPRTPAPEGLVRVPPQQNKTGDPPGGMFHRHLRWKGQGWAGVCTHRLPGAMGVTQGVLCLQEGELGGRRGQRAGKGAPAARGTPSIRPH